MKTYLVTGGAGFIGTNFIYYLFEKYGNNIRIINYDKLTYAGNLENLSEIPVDYMKNKNYIFIKGDICNDKELSILFNTYNPDIVVNFAAESHVDRSISNARNFIKTNIEGTHTLLEVTKNKWLNKNKWEKSKLFLHISTDEVYGELGKSGCFSETTPIAPRSPYSASKASADMIVKSYFSTFKMPVIISRCSNNYGPYQFPEKFIPLIINNCLNNRKIPVYGDGKNIRDWIYIEDHIRAINIIIEKGKPGEIYNIGGQNEIDNINLVKNIIDIIAKQTGININYSLVKFVKDRPGHDYRYAMNISKIANELKWKPEYSFIEGIEKTINWYITNRNWLNEIVNGEYMEYYKNMYENRIG
ncbi:dTDP-glucose 4,6-dehydratase [candidate division TA06 bacterium]|uniref:dTDP-glucose 4,6-dehydratase n=1 Tax=candidate division TA06 bacterium TaxID=2250710 RepID=A0A660SPJ0_UNCT6|nr:MAG: dTDP-glucose 4,6-dehydratase [candidate division TA06 bacterium]